MFKARALLFGATLMLLESAALAGLPIAHWSTSTGARVYFVESHALPMLDVSVEFAAGSSRDVASKSGAGSMTLRLMRMGAAGMDENSISEQLADVGAVLGSSFDVDRAGVSLRTLSHKQFREPALDIMSTLLARPTFPDGILARESQRVLAGLKEARMKPETLGGRALSRMVFGDHPYQLPGAGEIETLGAITRQDLVDFHARYYRAPGAVIALIGDITRAEAAAIAEQLTAALPTGAPPPAIPTVPARTQSELRNIPHDASQAHILLGTPGMKRGDPDYSPLFVGNYILGGGGFNSRLTYELREKRGLTYGIYSALSPYREAGAFLISMQTRREKAEEALQVIRDTVQEFLDNGPTEEELAGAKQNLIGGFPLRIDSSRKILDYLAVIGFYELPLDYLDQFTARIAEVTREQIKDAFYRRIDLARMATVVVGGEAK